MRIVGIEFGAWSVKAVELESRFRRLEVLDLHEVRVPLEFTDTVATYQKALEQLMGLLPSHPERISTSLPAANTALRFLKFPIKQRSAVEKAFLYELEDNVPFRLEDVLTEHQVYRVPTGSLVIVAVAPKKHCLGYLDWLKAVGLDPDWLTFDGMGLVDLYISHVSGETKGTGSNPTLLLDIGHGKTELAIVDQGRLEFFRTLSWGGMTVTRAIAVALNVPVEEAEHRKTTELRLSATPDSTNELMLAGHQAFAGLFSDISHTLVAFRNANQKEVKSAYVCGGTSFQAGFLEHLQRYLQIPCEPLNVLHGSKIKREVDPGIVGRFAEPMGRALVFARRSTLLFNFRKDELAKQTSLSEITAVFQNPRLVQWIKFAGLAALVLTINVIFSRWIAQGELAVAQKDAEIVFQETFRTVPAKVRAGLLSKPESLKTFIVQKNTDLEQKLKSLSKNRTPILNILLAVSQCFPPETKVDVNILQVDDRSLLVEGVLYQGDLGAIETKLKSSPHFLNVKVERQGQRFTVRGDVVGRI